MSSKNLRAVYDPQNFRQHGHKLVDTLADHLENTINENSSKVLSWNPPEDEHDFWKNFLDIGNKDDLFPEIIKRTTHVHHPKYIGHQVAAPVPLASLATLLSATLNNGMAVYEMGMSSSAIERVVTDLLCLELGYSDQANGFLTSGGTLANLTALLAARRARDKQDVWEKGTSKPLGILVSEEAHYCVERAARIMGLGSKGIIQIPSNSEFALDISAMESSLLQAKENGIQVFAIVGSAPSTATGTYDDLEAIANFSDKHGLWFHVDGAHGGAAIFSEKYKKTVKGIELADSVVIDGHKMMMMSIITTALLFKEGKHSHATFSQQADYLLEGSSDGDWYNLAKRTFECTKTMMSLQWYTLFKNYGTSIFDEFVTTVYDLGAEFGLILEKAEDFQLAVKPMSNIICFRFYRSDMSLQELNTLNESVRAKLLEAGEFYIVQTKIKGIHYLRVTIMNPFTTNQHLQQLLEKIRYLANKKL